MNTNYHILYYSWDEYTYEDCIECMRQLGYTVDVITGSMKDYGVDEQFFSKIKNCCLTRHYDFIFSFNYFPLLSRAADDCQIRYISWVFDSPHLTLDSVTLPNTCNAVFLFDHYLYQKYREKGITTVHHMPLAYNRKRIENKINDIVPHYNHEITFLGKLYDDEFNFFEQIHYLPPKLEGYIQAIIDAQQFIYGLDFCDLLFDHEKCMEMAAHVQIDLGDQFFDHRDEIFRNMIRKKITVMERRQILDMIGQTYAVDLYSTKAPKQLPVNYQGYADYISQMPEIFYTSKINLNMTLRSIITGIPLRIIDILGSHGFLLTNYQAELTEYFTNGKDLVWYESREDLMDKIAYYLDHDNEREQIAIHGNEKVQKYFSYTELLPKLIYSALHT